MVDRLVSCQEEVALKIKCVAYDMKVDLCFK
jgi:hypothetical protein